MLLADPEIMQTQKGAALTTTLHAHRLHAPMQGAALATTSLAQRSDTPALGAELTTTLPTWRAWDSWRRAAATLRRP
eukprot:1157087-Pelagomonas_calceolata.AAC.15